MTRVMIDATHNGLVAALPHIATLPAGSIVALYDTGSAGIIADAKDRGEIPRDLVTVFIDQGFTGSPNMSANIRDCENGAWSLNRAVNKTGWNVKRPTLYLGFPDTVGQAVALGWKGDVLIVHSSPVAPTAPPSVPANINVVGIQWGFGNPNFDVSVIFDPTWPDSGPPPHPGGTTVNVNVTMPVLAIGASGTAVRTLQGLLVARNHPVTIDGSFGPLTDSAVRSFQTVTRLVTDGVVGQNTWSRLFTG